MTLELRGKCELTGRVVSVFAIQNIQLLQTLYLQVLPSVLDLALIKISLEHQTSLPFCDELLLELIK